MVRNRKEDEFCFFLLQLDVGRDHVRRQRARDTRRPVSARKDRNGTALSGLLLVHARPSRLFPHLLVLMLADLLAPLLYDGRHSPSLGLRDEGHYIDFLPSAK
jgi:hypothetical protein